MRESRAYYKQAYLFETGFGSFRVLPEATIRYLHGQHSRQKGRRCEQIHRRMQENGKEIFGCVEKSVSEEIENRQADPQDEL